MQLVLMFPPHGGSSCAPSKGAQLSKGAEQLCAKQLCGNTKRQRGGEAGADMEADWRQRSRQEAGGSSNWDQRSPTN